MYEWTDEYEALLRAHCRPDDGVTSIQPDTRLAHLGIDSMEVVSLVVDLEDLLGFEFPEDLLTPEVFATPGTLWEALTNRRLP
jgi:acyl carrier protein